MTLTQEETTQVQQSIKRNRKINERDDFYSNTPPSWEAFNALTTEFPFLAARVTELENRIARLEGGFEMVAELASEDGPALTLVTDNQAA